MDWSAQVAALLDLSAVGVSLRAILLALVGILASRFAGRAVERALTARLDPHRAHIARRAVVYTLVLIFGLSVLRELGFDLSVLLGAAGVLTVAVGFASQTSASNVVSGLFLLLERPFGVGDIITVGGTTGEVIDIGLLSVTLRTFDNLSVRVPNESLVKAEITNLTAFPIRRIDVMLSVAYKDDIRKLESILIEIVDGNPLCLEEPRPLVIFTSFGDSGIGVQLCAWAQRDKFLEVRNRLYIDVKEALEQRGFEIPFPHVSVYAGSATEPLPLRIAPAAQPEPPPEGDAAARSA